MAAKKSHHTFHAVSQTQDVSGLFRVKIEDVLNQVDARDKDISARETSTRKLTTWWEGTE